ncbi:MAG: septum formation inhibitor Maf [Planctomycetes bacterium]|nr:septum formation inhibitor Maf [Planctomycetota bacterium]MBI3845127.1 septum formation inhibitor Maf [Planctomycetota bacterium]
MTGDPATTTATRLVLASGSERRRRILESLGVAFRQVVTDVDETPAPGEKPAQCAARLAAAKAEAAAARGPGVYLAADTIVVLDGEIIGKPRDPAHAIEILKRLSGRCHHVVTAVTMLDVPSGRRRDAVEESRVQIKALADDDIRAYVASGEPMDKAGAYAIQERGERFVERVDGSHSNVVGLPIERVLPLLAEFGIAVPRTAKGSERP